MAITSGIGASTAAAGHVAKANNPEFLVWAQEIARPVGTDDKTIQRAKDAINGAIRDYDRYMWKFERVLTPVTLETDTGSYELNHLVKGSFRAMLLDSTGTLDETPYAWADPVTFEIAKRSGFQMYTYKNFSADAKVYFWPVPTSVLNGRKIEVGTYQSAQRLSKDEDKFDGPYTYVGVLSERARYRFLRDSKVGSTAIQGEARAEAVRSLATYIAAGNATSDDPAQLVMLA